jgi:hypothetical protein
MATYGTKYFAYVKSFSGDTFTVNLKYRNYTGSSYQIRKYAVNPIQTVYRGGRKDFTPTITSSEFNFNFYSDAQDSDIFLEIIDSEIEDWQLQVLKNGVLYWLGFIQPDNISRSFLNPEYFIQLNATDGLIDLDNYDYPYVQQTDFASTIQVIKNCLYPTGAQLDFRSQVNLQNDKITGSTLLDNVYINEKRFVKNSEDSTTYVDASESLNWVLDAFYVELFQSRGYWNIIKQDEIHSPLTIYEHNSLSASTPTLNNRVIDINNYSVIPSSDELSRIRPLKKLTNTFYNKNLGEVITINGTLDTNINEWVNAPSPHNFYEFVWDAGRLKTLTLSPPFSSSSNTPHNFSGTTFNVVIIGTGNTVTVEMDIDLYVTFSATTPTPYVPKLRIELCRLTGGATTGVTVSTHFDVMSYGFKKYSVRLPVFVSGTYYIKTWIWPQYPEAEYSIIVAYFDNFFIAQNYPQQITYDKGFSAEVSGSTAIATEEVETYFGDARFVNDIGCTHWNSTTGLTSSKWQGLTVSSWRNYNTAQTSFSNSSFDGPSINPWVQDGSGVSWSYLGGLSNDVRANGSNSSKKLMQGPFQPGDYVVTISVKNDNLLGAGSFPANGVIEWLTRDSGGTYTQVVTSAVTRNIGYTTVRFSFSIETEKYMGFSCLRIGPGSSLDMSVSSVDVAFRNSSNYNAPLQTLYLYNRLRQRHRFKDFIRITIKSTDIEYGDILELNGKKYRISSMYNNLQANVIQLELVELIHDEYIRLGNFKETTLSTFDGKTLSIS